ncbi:CBO0543 family protein [Neobacillus novalis]|uniref:CBO0543 family protein n=1 Tax=Neobacillus novalis TaxID=220687 RepID=A0AA95SAU9_9BACI|nr:CBO0543 family protein [Neobacillus novalis]WHY86187.1 CBO0543 family protein [Neobacillus novalis]
MGFMEGIKESRRGAQLIIDGSDMMSKAVVDHFLFTWQWWFGIGLFVVPWIIWLLLRKRESTGRLLLAGFITIILALIIDLIAVEVGLWRYPMKFSPVAPMLLLPYHFSLVPVAIMFVLQIKPKANSLLKGAIFAALAAFGAMKFFVWIHFYDPKDWLSIYDFCIYLFLFYVAYWFSKIGGYESLAEQ